MKHIDFIMAYEGGEIKTEKELIAGFQAMIDDGSVWEMQGFYGRTARGLIDCGDCHE